jgi:hypothetical protein
MELVFSWAILFSLAVAAKAAISVTPTGTGVLTFDAAPPNTQWSSRHVLPNNGALITTVEALDPYVQTNIPTTINTTLPSVTGAANNNAAWHSSSFFLYTRPTGNSYQLLMGQFSNNSGADAEKITIEFDATNFSPPAGTEEAVGWRVYYSLSSASNNWIVIPEFSGFLPSGHLSNTVTLPSNWLAGTTLYLLFADDNANSFTDSGYSIDNFSMVAVPAPSTPISITSSPQSVSAAERDTVVFTVGATGSPRTYFWFKNGVQVPGNDQPTYTIPSAASPGDHNAQIYVVVSNSISFETSGTATLTVTPDTTPPVALSALSSPDRVNVTITFSEPMNPGFDVGSFHYFQNDTDPDVTAIYPDTATVVNGSNIVLNFASDPLDDGVNYSVRIFDVFDTAAAPPGGNQIQPYPTILPLRRALHLIELTGDWKYAVANNLFDSPTGWETVGYDDSDPGAWPSGPAPLGVDGTPNPNVPPIATPTAYPASSSLPQFFRRHFFLPANTNGVVLTMRHVFEDGAVVWINGQEAGRYNVAAGALSSATRTIGTRSETEPPTGPVVLPLTNVVAGDNVIAVAVLQGGATSTDIYMALELRADFDLFASGPPTFVENPQSQIVSEGANVVFTALATGALPLTYQWRKDGAPISGATNRTYSISGALPSASGDYDVVASNSVSTAGSVVASLVVNADNTPPFVILALGETNLSEIVLSFSEPISAGSAGEPGNYIIELTGGGGNIDVTTAVLVNGTNVVLTLNTPRVAGSNYTITVDSSITDLSLAQNSVSPTTYSVSTRLFLVAIDDVHTWRYDQTDTDLGTAWRTVGYNDSAWPSGNGLFHVVRDSSPTTVGGETVRTVLSLTNAAGTTNTTYYFRTHFSLPSLTTNGVVLQLSHLVDDAVVVYLNGNEVYRIGITNDPVYHTNYATANGGQTRQGPFLIPLTGLVSGDNVLAAEVHQVNMTSSDVTFGLELLAIIPVVTPIAGAPELEVSYNSGTGQITLTWDAPGFCLQETTALAGPSTVWGPSSALSGVAFTPVGTLKFYRLSNDCD